MIHSAHCPDDYESLLLVQRCKLPVSSKTGVYETFFKSLCGADLAHLYNVDIWKQLNQLLYISVGQKMMLLNLKTFGVGYLVINLFVELYLYKSLVFVL